MSKTQTAHSQNCSILLLAAGRSSRMRGTDKLLEPVGGMTLIKDRVLCCLETGCDVFVVASNDFPKRVHALSDSDAIQIMSDNAHLGLGHSLRDGLAQVSSEWVMIVLADMPALTTQDFNEVLAHARDSDAMIVRGATQAGQPGHPVMMRRVIYSKLQDLSGDTGAQEVLKLHRDDTELVALPGHNARFDLDTPEDWAKWRVRDQANEKGHLSPDDP